MCSNCRRITLLGLHREVFSWELERTTQPRVDPQFQDEQCRLRPGRATLDKFHFLHRVFRSSWEFTQLVHESFVDLEKVLERSISFWGQLSVRMESVQGSLVPVQMCRVCFSGV